MSMPESRSKDRVAIITAKALHMSLVVKAFDMQERGEDPIVVLEEIAGKLRGAYGLQLARDYLGVANPHAAYQFVEASYTPANPENVRHSLLNQIDIFLGSPKEAQEVLVSGYRTFIEKSRTDLQKGI